LVIAIDTDMAIPAQLDALHIEVYAHGELEFTQQYEVGPNQATLPATLSLVSRNIGDDPVSVRVATSKLGDDGMEWRTFREAITTIPRDRIATLRMPLQWLCKGQAEAVEDGDDSPLRRERAQSTCEDGQTCRAGTCVASEVDLASLPDYAPEELYGGGATPEAGSCFDTVGCMQEASTATPDDDCTIERPSTDRLNVALRVTDGGICTADAGDCYVPLNADDPEGWQRQDERVKLPAAVCDKLREGAVSTVLVSDTCKSKTEAVPTCGPWSDVPKGETGEYRPRGGGA
jgi:hypothetical protein